MLLFDRRAVEDKAAVVNAELPPNDPIWQATDPVPSGPLKVTGRLSSAGPGRFYWHGEVSGDIALPCRRCLADASAHVHDESHVIFADADSDEVDDPDVQVLDERSVVIDLRPTVREQWLLNAPAFAVCREDCKGMCPTCGKDLNEGPCDCPEVRAVDTRWDALKKITSKD